MHRVNVLAGGVAALAFAVGATSATAVLRPITQADSGKTFRLARGASATLRLSERWRWSTPRATTRAIELTPVEYLVDPGFREWQVDALTPGSVTVKALGKPSCSDCTLGVRSFRVTIVVSR